MIGQACSAVGLDRDDLPRKPPVVGGRVRQPVRAQRELVELRAGDLLLVRDHLGAEALAVYVVAVEQPARERVPVLLVHRVDVRERDVVHVLDPGTDHHIERPGGRSAPPRS